MSLTTVRSRRLQTEIRRKTPPAAAPPASAQAERRAVAKVAGGFHIPSLDGLRGVAFLIVFASHAVTPLVPGGFGVTIFFFLSGYLITTLLRVEWQSTGSVSLANFYKRRALRIFPNFYIVLVAATLLAGADVLSFVGGRVQIWAVLCQALYANNYLNIFHGDSGAVRGTGVLWSLAVEEHFYLVFPLIFLALMRLTRRPAARVAGLAALCAAALVWRTVVVFGTDLPADWYTYAASDARFDSILYGSILALAGNPALDPPRGSDRFWQFVAAPIALAVLAATFVVRNDAFRWTARYTVQGLALIPLFVAAIRCHRSAAFSWLGWRWLRFLGTLSYTLYLVHLIVLDRMTAALGDPAGLRKWAGVAGAFGISLLLAVLMHRLVERPLARWRKRLHNERQAPALRPVTLIAR